MEKNDVMVLNEIILHLYEHAESRESLREKERHFLVESRAFFHCSYASVLHADAAGEQLSFCDPVCVPETFSSAEEAYIRISGKDHMLWSSEAGRPAVVRESRMLSAAKRLETPIYLSCYQPFDVYDTLQANLFDGNRFLGVVTLYRTRKEGEFSDDDVFMMQLLTSHLARLAAEKKAAPAASGTKKDRAEELARQYGLTDRESGILEKLLQGDADEDIAESLSISVYTLRKHLQHIYKKLGIRARWELVKFLA